MANVDPKDFFCRIRIQNYFLPDTDSETNTLTRQFSKEWLSLLSYTVYSGTWKNTEKQFCHRKTMHFAIFHVLTIFLIIFIF
jgi:hypothetical protein